MAKRTTRYQTDEEGTENVDYKDCCKRQKTDNTSDSEIDFPFEDDKNFKRAVEILQKKKEQKLHIIRTKLNLHIEGINALKKIEENNISHHFKEQQHEINKIILNEKRKAAENGSDISLSSHKFDLRGTSTPCAVSKRDQCVFTVPLSENDIVDDLLYMANNTKEVYEHANAVPDPIAAPLSHNRLLLNNHIIYPNIHCSLYNNGTRMYDGIFTSTVVKEKEYKDKRKEPEVWDNKILSATRKRRFAIESLRNGELEMVVDEQELLEKEYEHRKGDTHSVCSDLHSNENDSEHLYY